MADNITGTCREIPMIRAKRDLEESIEIIGKLSGDLCNRLETSCSPPLPTEKSPPSPDKLKQSQAVEEIEIFTNRIRNITLRLQDTLQRLEI